MPPTLAASEFKKEMLSGSTKLGLFLMSCSPMISYAGAYAGYDWLLIDAQHSPVDYHNLLTMVATIKTNHNIHVTSEEGAGEKKAGTSTSTTREVMVVVRVASAADRPGIQNALDCGADGVIIPYVNTRKELEEAVSCCFYAPRGTRSFANTPCMFRDGLSHYMQNADKNIIVGFQVETQACIDDLDNIMGVEGVDMAYLGPFDQSFSMGLYQKYHYDIDKMLHSPELTAVVDKMAAAAARHPHVSLGVYLTGPQRVKEFMDKGFRFITLGNDVDCFQSAANERRKKALEITGGKPAPSNTL